MQREPVTTLRGILREQFHPSNISKIGGHQSGSTVYADLISTDYYTLPEPEDTAWGVIKGELEYRLGQEVKKFELSLQRDLTHACDGISLWVVL